MSKRNILITAVLLIAAAASGGYFLKNSAKNNSDTTDDAPVVNVPMPSSDGRTTFVGEPVPWHLLLADASCELKGEIKYLNSKTYDNQDAMFIYRGVDNPGRNVIWTVSPKDDILIGPNIFSNIPIPNGESLLGISLPKNPIAKRYELTAKIQYGRLVDEKGDFVFAGGTVKNFEKQCKGKTVVVLP